MQTCRANSSTYLEHIASLNLKEQIMALSETQEIKIEIASNGTVFVDTITKVRRDGTEIASESNRTGYHPGASVSSLPQYVQDVCTAVWTPEVIAAYQAVINQAV